MENQTAVSIGALSILIADLVLALDKAGVMPVENYCDLLDDEKRAESTPATSMKEIRQFSATLRAAAKL
ncbi:MAG: hypothetical protein ACRYF5_02185 [Janthinobacterium lividum]